MTSFNSKNRQYYVEDLDIKKHQEIDDETSEALTPLDYFMWGYYIAKKDPTLSETDFKKFIEMPIMTFRKKIRQASKIQKFVDILEEFKPAKESKLSLVEEENLVPECSLCIEKLTTDQFQLADCKHSYHKGCLSSILKRSINFNQPATCSAKGCNAKISNEEIHANLGGEYLRKLSETDSHRSRYPASIQPSRNISSCPNLNCEYKFAYQGKSAFSCPKCYKQYCLDCKVESYIHGDDCCSYKAKNPCMNDSLFKSGCNYKECPHCNFWVSYTIEERIRCRCGNMLCLVCKKGAAKCKCENSNRDLDAMSTSASYKSRNYDDDERFF